VAVRKYLFFPRSPMVDVESGLEVLGVAVADAGQCADRSAEQLGE